MVGPIPHERDYEPPPEDSGIRTMLAYIVRMVTVLREDLAVVGSDVDGIMRQQKGELAALQKFDKLALEIRRAQYGENDKPRNGV